MIGKTIAHYRIIEKIGCGGMGEVYLAEDTKLDRQVALKFLPAKFSADEEERKRFIHEARAASALDHPNICSIYEIGETPEGQLFIAMGYYAGKTLKEKIKEGPLPVAEATRIAIQIAEGLAAAHAKGIVHRDIKPANIMLSESGTAKIVDFGLAKLRGLTRLTKSGTTLGTVAYMSPEQVQGKEVDQRTDIWSLGVVFYEMLTGKLPFPGEYDQALMYAILNEEPEPVTGLRSGVPIEFDRILAKALAKDREERYQHLEDLLVDLRRAKRDSKPVSAVKLQPKTAMPSKKKQGLKIAVSLFLVAAAAAGAVYLLFKGKEKPAALARTSERPCVAVVYFENNSGDKSMDKWRSQLAELLITDLSQSRLIDVVSGDQVFSILKKLDLLDVAKYTTEDLRRVADQSGSDYVLHGSYITAGKNLLINVSLAEVKTGKMVSALSVESQGEEGIFSKVDEITHKIKMDLDFTPPQLTADPEKALETITTSSPQAFTFFNEGEIQKRLGNYRECIELMKKAVALDPGFAMAWRSMAAGYGNLGYADDVIKYMKKALEHIDRVSERERLLIIGQYNMLRDKSKSKAIESFQQVLQLYPNDFMADFRLGVIFYYNLEEWDKAEQLFKKHLLDHDENNIFWSSVQLSFLYSQVGQYKKALQVLTDYQTRFPGNNNIIESIAYNYLQLGEYDAALAAIDKALTLSPSNMENIQKKAQILLDRGELTQAEAWFRKMLDSPEPVDQLTGLFDLSYIIECRGRLDEARSFYPRMLALSVKSKQAEWERRLLRSSAWFDRQSRNWTAAQKKYDRILSYAREADDWTWLRNIFIDKGVAFAEAGQFSEAEKMAAELQVYIDKGLNKKLQRDHDYLLGLIALKRGDTATAISLINQAISLLPGGASDLIYPAVSLLKGDRKSFRDTLGDAYFQAGRFAEARQAYESITLSPTGRGDFEYGRCLFKLGKTYQKLGDKDKAILNYSQFIDYWSNCDPQFRPLLAEAKAELQKLQGKI